MPSTQETREYCAEQVRGVNRDKRTISIIASDFSRDSYNTRLDPKGWDVKQFKKNPVILGAHNDRQFALANAVPETVRTINDQLVMDIQFPDAGKYPDADIAFELYADGFMRGVSVGFSPTEWEDVNEQDDDGNDIPVRIFRKMKLMEVSLVTLPANDNALAVTERSARMGADATMILRRMHDLEEILEANPSIPTKSMTKKATEEKRSTDAEVEQKSSNVEDAGEHNNVQDSKRDDEQMCEHGKVLTDCQECYGKKSHNQVEEVNPDDPGRKADDAEDAKDGGADEGSENEGNEDNKEKQDKSIGDAYIEKCVAYFERKQPANRAATKVLAKFYKLRGIEQPSEEIEAWERMGELLDEPKEEEKVEVKEKLITPTNSVVEEAPQRAPKASVQIPLSSLPELRKKLQEEMKRATEEALRKGVPQKKLEAHLRALGF